jgi:hypothetical protein
VNIFVTSYVFCHFQVKFAELTLDTYRMMQCLEWEPSESFYQKRPVESVYKKHPVELSENSTLIDHSGASGLININLAADLTDPSLPSNPRKAVLYRPSVTYLLAVSSEDLTLLSYPTLSFMPQLRLLCFQNEAIDVIFVRLFCLHYQDFLSTRPHAKFFHFIEKIV